MKKVPGRIVFSALAVFLLAFALIACDTSSGGGSTDTPPSGGGTSGGGGGGWPPSGGGGGTGTGTGSGATSFVAVTGITGVPTAATVGTPLTLSGTVAPGNATNSAITWGIQNNGGTNASISGNTLNVTQLGLNEVIGTPIISDIMSQDGTISINGISVSVLAGETVATVLGNINGVIGAAGVDAVWIGGDLHFTGLTVSDVILGGSTAIWAELGFVVPNPTRTVTVRATVVHGTNATTNFTQDFPINVTTAPPPTSIAWTGITANGTSGTTTTTELTLTFDADPTSLAAADISVIGATGGTLSATGNPRTFTISNITVANGESVTVDISNPIGYTITPISQSIAVYLSAADILARDAAQFTPQPIPPGAGGGNFMDVDLDIWLSDGVTVSFAFITANLTGVLPLFLNGFLVDSTTGRLSFQLGFPAHATPSDLTSGSIDFVITLAYGGDTHTINLFRVTITP